MVYSYREKFEKGLKTELNKKHESVIFLKSRIERLKNVQERM